MSITKRISNICLIVALCSQNMLFSLSTATDARITTISSTGADLAITKTSSIPTNKPVKKGDIITYTLNYDNLGPSSASDATITDTLPEGTCLNVSDLKLKLPTGTVVVFFDKNKNIITSPKSIDCTIRSFSIKMGNVSYLSEKITENTNSFSGHMMGDVYNYSGLTIGGKLQAEQMNKPYFENKALSHEKRPMTYFSIDGKHYVHVSFDRETRAMWYEFDPLTSTIIGERHEYDSGIGGNNVSYFTMGNNHYLMHSGGGDCNPRFQINPETGTITKMDGCVGQRLAKKSSIIRDENGNIHILERSNRAKIDASTKKIEYGSNGYDMRTDVLLEGGGRSNPIIHPFKYKNNQYTVIGSQVAYFDQDDGSFNPVANLGDNFSSVAVFPIGDTIYIVTNKKVYRFNDDESITELANISNVGIDNFSSSFVMNDKGYAVSFSDYNNIATIYEFDPATHTVVLKRRNFGRFDSMNFFESEGKMYAVDERGTYRINDDLTFSSFYRGGGRIGQGNAIQGPVKYFSRNRKDYVLSDRISSYIDIREGSTTSVINTYYDSNPHIVFNMYPFIYKNNGYYAGAKSGVIYFYKVDTDNNTLQKLPIKIEDPDRIPEWITKVFIIKDNPYLVARDNGYIMIYKINLENNTRKKINTGNMGYGRYDIEYFSKDDQNYIVTSDSGIVEIHELKSDVVSKSIVTMTGEENEGMIDVFEMNGKVYSIISAIKRYAGDKIFYNKRYRVDPVTGKYDILPKRSLGKGIGTYFQMYGKRFWATADRIYRINEDETVEKEDIAISTKKKWHHFIAQNKHYVVDEDRKNRHHLYLDGTTGSYQTVANAGDDIDARKTLTYDIDILPKTAIVVSIYGQDDYTGTPLLQSTLSKNGQLDISEISSTYKKLYIKYTFSKQDPKGESPVLRSRSVSYKKKPSSNRTITYEVQVTNDDRIYDATDVFTNTATINSQTTDSYEVNNKTKVTNAKIGKNIDTDLSSLTIIPIKTITQGENLNLRNLITKATDENGNDAKNKVKIILGTYKNTVIGSHVVIYSLARDGKNPLTKQATITVKEKQTTPTLKPRLVVHNTEMTQGDNLDLRSLIDQATYTNGTDARAVVTVNSVGFDPNSPGVYTITYVLQEGNIFTQAKATVTVHKKSVNPNPNPNPNPGETMTAEKARIIAQNSVCKDKGTLIKKPFDGVVWRSFPIRTSQGEIYCRIDKKSKKVSIEGHGTGALIEPTLTVKRTATVVKGSSFDPRSLITKAVDQKGKDMTSEVIIDTDGLDIQKIGAYTVKYRLRVDGKFLRAESYIAVVEKSTTDPSNGTGSTKAFTTQYSLTDSKIFKKNDCPVGTFPSAVNYVTTATKTGTAPTETQADLLAKQAAELAVMKDILANGQTYANTHGKCTPKAQVGVVGLPHTGATR